MALSKLKLLVLCHSGRTLGNLNLRSWVKEAMIFKSSFASYKITSLQIEGNPKLIVY